MFAYGEIEKEESRLFKFQTRQQCYLKKRRNEETQKLLSSLAKQISLSQARLEVLHAKQALLDEHIARARKQRVPTHLEKRAKSTQDCANDMWARAALVSQQLESKKTGADRLDLKLSIDVASESNNPPHFSRINLCEMRGTEMEAEVLSKEKMNAKFPDVNAGNRISLSVSSDS